MANLALASFKMREYDNKFPGFFYSDEAVFNSEHRFAVAEAKGETNRLSIHHEEIHQH